MHLVCGIKVNDKERGAKKWIVESDGRWWANIQLNDVKVLALLDSGASVSVMSLEIFKNITGTSLQKSNAILHGAFSKNIQCLGESQINMIWQNSKQKIKFLVVKSMEPKVILGMSVFRAFDLKIGKVSNIEVPIGSKLETSRVKVSD